MSQLDHAAAQILDQMRQLTPQAAHVAGRVLQIEASVWIMAGVLAVIFAGEGCKILNEIDNKDAKLGAFVVLVLFGLGGLLAIFTHIASALSPDYALAVRIMDALPK